MKKTFCIILILFSLLAKANTNHDRLDSLQIKLESSSNEEWVKTAIALSDELYIDEPDLSESLLNEAIEYSRNQDYSILLANAYQLKGARAYEQNKVLTGITYFQKSFSIFSTNNLDTKSVKSLIGIANGLTRIKRNKESVDTLNYVLNSYYDSLSVLTKSNIFHLISSNYYDQGENENAIHYLDSAIKVEKANDLKSYLANTYHTVGLIYDGIGNYKNAIYYFDKCEVIAREIHDTLLVSYMLHNKANIYYQWGVFDEALDLFLTAKNMTINLGRNEELPSSFSSIGLIYHEYKDFDKAKQYYLQSIRLAEEYNDPATKSISMHNLGEMMASTGRYDTALILLNQSMQYEMEKQNTLGIAQSKNAIAKIYIALEKFPLAFEYYKEAEQVFLKFGSKSYLANLYVDMGNAHSKLENDSLSIHYFEKGVKISEQIGDIPTTIEAYYSISKNYERMEDYKMALSNYKKYKQLNDSIFNDNASKRIDYLGLRLEKQEKEKQLEQLENERKLLEADKATRNMQLVATISVSILIVIFLSIMYAFIKRSETRIKQQYQVLLESEQKIKALLDASFDSTILVDKKGIIQAANNNNLSGFLPDIQSMISKPILSLFEKTNQKVLSKYIELVYSSKLYKELRIHDKNNIVLNLKISPVQNVTDQVISLAFYIQDITQIELDKQEKKKMEEQLIHTQKMETIGTMAGGIAHDFNNYLATIKGYVSMSIEDTEDDSTLNMYLTKALKAVNLSQETVKKLLTFSRSKDMEFNKFKLYELIEDSVDIVKGSKPRNIKFIHNNASDSIELLGEKNQLTQVLLNICTNAFHAIEAETGGVVELKVEDPRRIEDLNNKYCSCIKVADNGIGMKKDTMERIFEPFFTTKEVGKGTGLGLSVVNGIVKQHGGKIDVESEFGKGTEFSLYLPIIS